MANDQVSPRLHGPFSIKLVGWNSGIMQINVVCTHCNSNAYINSIFQLPDFLRMECPPFVVTFEPLKETGAFDYNTLIDELEKRDQI